MKQILIIEDDKDLMRGISFVFEKDGYAVKTAGTITDGRTLFQQNEIDMVILDWGLPDGEGIDLCKEIRTTSDTPVIMLTAHDLETDEVSGLMAGADDYITKPFSLSVLRARVDTILRRLRTKSDQGGLLQSGPFRLDVNLCKLYKGAEEIPISATEFRLLKYFIQNAGQVLTKEQILASLWDNQGNFVDENTLSVNISRLRAKIEDNPKSPQILKTIHGIGYIWEKG